MTPRSLIAVTAVLLGITLVLVSSASAASSRKGLNCCMAFTNKRIPFERILGYREIRESENCRRKAYVFYTIMKREICAKPGEPWVEEALAYLSAKLKKISATNDQGSFSGTTEMVPKTTDGYYW